MNHPDDLRTIFAGALHLSEQAFELKTEFAIMRQVATDRGFDWSQIKALASASVADAEAGDHKRVEKLVSKADFAAAYADMLGLRQDERKHETRSSSQIAVQNRVNLADVARINERALANQAALQSQSVASPSSRSQSGGAAISIPAPPSGTAASNSEIEGAARAGPHLNGRIEPLGNDGLDAPSSVSDEFNDIPLCLRRTADGGFVQV